MSPFGRKASDQGRFSPFIGTTRNVCSWVWNTCGSGDSAPDGGQSGQLTRCAACWAAAGATGTASMAMAAAMATNARGAVRLSISISCP